MSMYMSPDDLEALAVRIKVLQDTGVEIKVIRFQNHEIYLGVDQQDRLFIRGITDKIDKPAGNTSVRTGVLTSRYPGS